MYYPSTYLVMLGSHRAREGKAMINAIAIRSQPRKRRPQDVWKSIIKPNVITGPMLGGGRSGTSEPPETYYALGGKRFHDIRLCN